MVCGFTEKNNNQNNNVNNNNNNIKGKRKPKEKSKMININLSETPISMLSPSASLLLPNLNKIKTPKPSERNKQNDEPLNCNNKIGVRFSATMCLPKSLFTNKNKSNIITAKEILLKAIKRITSDRWIPSDSLLNIRYLIDISQDISLPKQFKKKKSKRGLPRKNKKEKSNENNKKETANHNNNILNDKIYRVNYELIFNINDIDLNMRHKNIINDIIVNISIDLNQYALSMLLCLILGETVKITEKVEYSC